MIAPNINEANKTFAKVEVMGKMTNFREVTVSLFFRDVNGVEWCRDSRGGLWECPGYPKRFEKKDS